MHVTNLKTLFSESVLWSTYSFHLANFAKFLQVLNICAATSGRDSEVVIIIMPIVYIDQTTHRVGWELFRIAFRHLLIAQVSWLMPSLTHTSFDSKGNMRGHIHYQTQSDLFYNKIAKMVFLSLFFECSVLFIIYCILF
jgi:hypothetical protein